MLEQLNLSGNVLTDIRGLSGLAKLETLNLAHNNISFIGPLASCLSLTQ